MLFNYFHNNCISIYIFYDLCISIYILMSLVFQFIISIVLHSNSSFILIKSILTFNWVSESIYLQQMIFFLYYCYKLNLLTKKSISKKITAKNYKLFHRSYLKLGHSRHIFPSLFRLISLWLVAELASMALVNKRPSLFVGVNTSQKWPTNTETIHIQPRNYHSLWVYTKCKLKLLISKYLKK